MSAKILEFKPRLDFSGEYAAIPLSTQIALSNYIEHGSFPGAFLLSVLSNKLTDTVLRADENNLRAIRLICLYIYNEIPSCTWGSGDKIYTWIRKFHPNV